MGKRPTAASDSCTDAQASTGLGLELRGLVDLRRDLTRDWSGPLGADRDRAADLTVCRAWWSSNCLGLR
jgi:hypothetical protein